VEEEGITTANVISGLIGGAAGSVLTFFGGWFLATRSERRHRRARLTAIESELKNNEVFVEGALEGNAPPFKLSDYTWEKIHVDLSLDMPRDEYRKLQNSYRLFPDAKSACDRLINGMATEQDEKNLQFWLQSLRQGRALVTGRLHLFWGLRAWIEGVGARLKQKVLHRGSESS